MKLNQINYHHKKSWLILPKRLTKNNQIVTMSHLTKLLNWLSQI